MDVSRLLKLSGKYRLEIDIFMKKVVGSFQVCFMSGHPFSSRKVSIINIYKWFNESVLVDYFFFPLGILSQKNAIFHERCCCSGYYDAKQTKSILMSETAKK